MQKMLLLATVSTVALVIAGNANSADFPRKAPSMVAATAPYSWTGCYVGAHVGWGWGHQNVTPSSSSFSSGNTASGGLDSSGGLFGGQVGCNYQFAGSWVAGLQGDLAGADINGRGNDPLGVQNSSSSNYPTTIGVKTDWIASVTGRLGMTAWNDRTLFYVKGGVAWDHNQWDLHDAWLNYQSTSQLTETRSGWTVGGGVEWAFVANWSAFAEFNYYDFGNGSTLVTNSLGNTFSTGRQTIETAKIGVNYKFYGGN